MKNCTGCKYAEWRRTKAGKLHPSGVGRCTFQVKMPAIPASMYFLNPIIPCGGSIDRHHESPEHCPCYNRVGADEVKP